MVDVCCLQTHLKPFTFKAERVCLLKAYFTVSLIPSSECIFLDLTFFFPNRKVIQPKSANTEDTPCALTDGLCPPCVLKREPNAP